MTNINQSESDESKENDIDNSMKETISVGIDLDTTILTAVVITEAYYQR